jgi:pantoate--beta-alanine ligase
MKRFTQIVDYQSYRQEHGDLKIGFVPTMGALHAGHAALIRQSVAECDHTILSIYVNPTQFDNPEDLAKYPDMIDQDASLAESLGVDVLLIPDYEQLYPDSFSYLVDETQFSHQLCGEHRAGHFTGVLTVVMKLLNIVKPTKAYFGEKDYQQLSLIRGMAQAFFLDATIVGSETVREADGLALSSRNLNLTSSEREKAAVLNQMLGSNLSDEAATAELQSRGFRVDYIQTRGGRRFGAATLGSVRLIDNVRVTK